MKVKRILAAVVAFAMLLTMSVVSFATAPVDFPEYEYEILGSMDITATDGWKGPEKDMTLDAAMVFAAIDDYDAALASPYAKWIADFVIEFDQDVTATLAGNYGSYGWIASPEIDFEAGVAYGIMKESGLDAQKGDNGEAINTYENIVLMVNEFVCGLEFAEDTPADAKVTLGLYLTNPEDETETYLVGKAFTFTTFGLLPEYKAEEIEVDGLDFAMMFTATDDWESAMEGSFGTWYADYEITFSNDATAVLAGEYGDYGWVSLDAYDFKAGVPVQILKEGGFEDFTYADICLAVKEFQCGVDAIDVPYGTTITLNLTLTNDEGEKIVLGENVFTYAVLETAEDVNELTEEQIEANVDAIKDAIAELDSDAKQAITTEVIEKIVADEVAANAATSTPAAFSADKTVEVEVEVEATDDPALDGAETFDITAYENGAETTEVAMPVLVAVPVKSGATLAKIVHVHNGVAKEVDFWVEGNMAYFWMSEFSYIGLYYAGEATLKFEKVAEDTFDIVLAGDEVETVKNFVSGQFKMAVTGDVEYTITGIEDKTNVQAFADGSVLVNVPNFVNGSSWTSTITDETITLATVKVTSLGEGTITLSDAVMHKHDGSSSNLWAPITTIIGNAASFDIAAGAEDLDEHNLVVKVIFNNEVEYAEADYNAMTVTINGVDYALGSDNVDVVMGSTDCSYTVTAEVEEMATFDITVAGKGYRTAYYNGTMGITDRVVTFWNNAENNAQVRDVDAMGNIYATSYTNFLAGDVYMDNIINRYDLSAVVGYFGQEDLADYDLNRDGKVDSKDVAYVLVSWGK